ncbi:ppk32 [Malassezia furfur]|nr:ppk32 [Malassezia furfur]
MEESRGELTFATERVSMSLSTSLSARSNPDNQLDEIEIRKGLLQRLHTNLTPSAIIINAKGDWKLAGVGYSTVLDPESPSRTRWAYEDEEQMLPVSMQRNMDYMDPMYVLDGTSSPANDMFSLGILIFAIFHHGNIPYQTHGSANALRSYADHLPDRIHTPSWQMLGPDVQGSNLITRSGNERYNVKTFQTLSYFNSILVSVLKFLERDSFAARTKQEKVQFLRGLHKMLPQFSPALQRRKLLPSVRGMLTQMTEIMADRSLLPYILPNVFAMASNILLLLNQTDLFVSKMTPSQFREGTWMADADVMPLFYASFENEHIAVQENALQKVPQLCELLEFSHVKDTLLPKLMALFSKTKTLSVKVSALVASLAVYEAIAAKVDRDVQATAVLPRLWVMSMFARFMRVIRQLGEKIEREQMVGDAQGSRKSLSSTMNASNDLDFETLVGQTQSAASTGLDLFADVPGTPTTEMPALLDSVPKSVGAPRSNSVSVPNAVVPNHVRASHAPKLSSPLAPPPRPMSATVSQPATPSATPSGGLFDALMADKPANPPATTVRPPLPQTASQPNLASTPGPTAPPGWGGGLLVPERKSTATGPTPVPKSTWADFDPLK